jgi:hypothetical protein
MGNQRFISGECSGRAMSNADGENAGDCLSGADFLPLFVAHRQPSSASPDSRRVGLLNLSYVCLRFAQHALGADQVPPVSTLLRHVISAMRVSRTLGCRGGRNAFRLVFFCDIRPLAAARPLGGQHWKALGSGLPGVAIGAPPLRPALRRFGASTAAGILTQNRRARSSCCSNKLKARGTVIAVVAAILRTRPIDFRGGGWTSTASVIDAGNAMRMMTGGRPSTPHA